MTIAEQLAINNIKLDLENGKTKTELRELYKEFLIYDSVKELLKE